MTNKEIVLKVYEELFNGRDLSAIDRYVKEDYIQHNPTVETGREGFRKFCEFFLGMKPRMEILRCAEDGDTVFVFFKCTLENGAVNKVCDIYRLEDGMLAEHWDVVEHDVHLYKPVNENGVF